MKRAANAVQKLSCGSRIPSSPSPNPLRAHSCGKAVAALSRCR